MTIEEGKRRAMELAETIDNELREDTVDKPRATALLVQASLLLTWFGLNGFGAK